MGKSIKVVDKDFYNNVICESLHLSELYSQFAKTTRIENISMDQAINGKWGSPGECLLVAHSFSAWDIQVWKSFLDKNKCQLFVIPTEILNDEIMKETFNHPNISKIILNNENSEYRKLFKSYGIENQKIKYISIPSSLHLQKSLKKPSYKKIIVCPGMLSNNKNYNALLIAAEKITSKHRDSIFVFLLKSPGNLDTAEVQNIVNKIYQDSLKLRLKSENFVILLDKELPYVSWLNQADIILSQQKSEVHMYDGTIIDGIALSKPVVAGYSTCSVTFASKQDLGVHIYEYKNDKNKIYSDEKIAYSIFQNCSIILDNSDIAEIMSQQNAEFIPQLDVNNVIQQYFNLVKRSKNA